MNKHLVRITVIKRSFTENDHYTSPSLEIHYINIDTQQNLIKMLTPLSPHWNFFLKTEESLKLKLSHLNPAASFNDDTVTSKMGNCFSFELVFPYRIHHAPYR